MLESGDAFQQDPGPAPPPPAAAAAEGAPKRPRLEEGVPPAEEAGEGDPGDQPVGGNEVEAMDIGALLGKMCALSQAPTVDLAQDPRLRSTKFPLDKLQAGREKEIASLTAFDAFEEIDQYDGTVYDMIWVDEWRGDLVRSRACVRQYKEEKRDDVFAATPETSFTRFVLSEAASHEGYAVLIADVSVAFMHARLDEEIVVKPPPGVQTSKFWRLKAAVNGIQRASQLWQEHSAHELVIRGFDRNDVNPCVFYHPLLFVQLEQHGDDFFGTGPRESILEVKRMLENAFLVKKTDVISLHVDDDKEGHFLKRKITVDDDGWHSELDERYAQDLVTRLGLESAKAVVTPGTKDAKKQPRGKVLGAKGHREYRGGAGVAQYMAEHRADAAFATKQLMRDAAGPDEASWNNLKRVARYIKGRPRCIIDFPWRVAGVAAGKEKIVLDTYGDSDWADENNDRKSTSGGMMFSKGHLLRHWSSTQATQSLSSAEAETKALTKSAIESLYMKHLLEQQGFEVEIVLHSDASAAIGAAQRLGAGKRMKHLEIQDLWIQQLVRSKILTIKKVSTHENPSDILTKHVGRDWLDKVCGMCNMRFPGENPNFGVGRSAPVGEDEVDDPEAEKWGEDFAEALEGLRYFSMKT